MHHRHELKVCSRLTIFFQESFESVNKNLWSIHHRHGLKVCSRLTIFFQESFESESKRLESFPTNWAEINGLAVSVEEIAIAGQVGFKGVARELVERKPR